MAAPGARPRVLYAAPWGYLSTRSGVTRNVLSVARELSRYAEVTVAFRRFLEPPPSAPFGAVAIESSTVPGPDDLAIGGRPRPTFLTQLRYLHGLRRFAAAQASRYDLVLEKSWRLSGHLVDEFGRHGVPGAVVENVVPTAFQLGWGVRRRLLFAAQVRLVRRYLRRSPLVIAETAQLRRALVKCLGLCPERIAVVGLGLDHDLFRPRPMADARRRLGIPEDQTMMLYCGGLDRYHDVRPVVEALMEVQTPGLRLHIIGDGCALRDGRTLSAGAERRLVFHGTVPHEDVPGFVAAADLCLAPYRPEAFPDGEVTFFTLKIPEFMACARPVASVPSGHIRQLIGDGITGFLRPNHRGAWAELLAHLPSRQRLREMGAAAPQAVAHLSWEATAASYWAACLPLLNGAGT